MQASPFTKDKLPTVQEWWDMRDEGTMPAEVLPPDGVLVTDHGQPVAAAWLYLPDGCKVATLDWLVTRPGMTPERIRKACRLALRYLAEKARSYDRSYLFASVSRDGMEKEAIACGFRVASTHNTHLVLPL